jgi:hypothetical protein
MTTLRVHAPSERGSTSVLALFLVVALGGLSVGLVQESAAGRSAVLRQETSLRALEIAEAAITRAESEIRSQVDLGTDGVGVVSGEFGGGAYEVTVAPDPVSADRFVLRAKGTHGLSTRRIEVGVRRRAKALFAEGLFSKDSLVVNGDQATDAYDSRLGSYASQAVNSDAGGPYAMQGGHLGSNGSVELIGSANYVRGNAIAGPLHETVLSGSPMVTGDMIPRDEEIEVAPTPKSEFEAAVASNANGTWTVAAGSVAYDPARMSLRVDAHAVVVLAGGTYFFSDLTLKAGATLRVTGPVKIYATGSVDLGGGAVVNTTGASTNLLLYVHPYALPSAHPPSTTEVKVAGHPQAAMGLYAPDVPLTISGGSEFFGAAVASEITLNGNTFFHYDVALGSVGVTKGSTFERLYWREISPPRR